MSRGHRAGTVGLTVLPLLVAAAAAGCGGLSSGPPVATARPGQPLTISVVLRKDGCEVSPSRVGSGSATFAATNVDDAATSEVAVARGGVVLAENEGVGPGLKGSIALRLAPGTYDVLCLRGGGETVRKPVDVVAVPPAVLTADERRRDRALADAVAGYRRYLADQTTRLVAGTTALEQAVLAGDLERARALYPAARVPYERIEPVAESFPDLDETIDARRNDVTPGLDWAGFHRLEYALFARRSLGGSAYYARNLVLDVSVLRARVASIPLQPAQLADGADALLDEVGATKITGEEERYSHVDLVDVRANVDGAQEAFDLLAPAITDEATVRTIRERFRTVDAALARYRAGPGPTAFRSYAQVPEAGRRSIAQAVDALASPLALIPATVG